MTYSTFIDENYIYSMGQQDENVDPQLFKAHIIGAQDTFIKDILGYNLFYECMDLVTNDIYNDVAITGIFEILIDEYIRKAHYWYFMYLIPRANNYKYTNTSIAERGGVNSTPTSEEKVISLKYENLATAKKYAASMINFIEKNIESFPNYNNNDCDEGPVKGKYYSGIYLGPRNK